MMGMTPGMMIALALVRTCDEWLVFLEPDEEAGGTTRVGRWNPEQELDRNLAMESLQY